MEYWCIYQITNKINGKRYIGQHKYYDENNPMYRYYGSGKHLWEAYRKYGKENFITEILYKRILSLETANAMEIYAIAKYKPEYNITKGGHNFACSYNKGKKLSAEYRKKLSEAHKGYRASDETRKKLSEANKGHRHTEESKRIMSEKAKGRKFSEEHRRKLREAKLNNPVRYWLGKSRPSPSEETIRKRKETRLANKRKEKENETV